MDFEFKAYFNEQDVVFDWKAMPTVRELAGEALESFVDESQKDLTEKRSKALKAAYEEWERLA